MHNLYLCKCKNWIFPQGFIKDNVYIIKIDKYLDIFEFGTYNYISSKIFYNSFEIKYKIKITSKLKRIIHEKI